MAHSSASLSICGTAVCVTGSSIATVVPKPGPALTAAILPVLPASRSLYCFTDLSKFFFDHAREKFKQYSSLRFGLLDIEKSPAEQGFGDTLQFVRYASLVARRGARAL